MKLNDQEELTLLVGAFRYYTGRMTYAVSDFCDLLCANWGSLSDRTKQIISKELEEEFRRDDEARERQKTRDLMDGAAEIKTIPKDATSFYPLGQDCDRRQWERVRRLYKS